MLGLHRFPRRIPTMNTAPSVKPAGAPAPRKDNDADAPAGRATEGLAGSGEGSGRAGGGGGRTTGRGIFLDLAASGLRMPIGTHLELHTHTDPDAVVLDAERLASVITGTAERFGTPLAMPLMDLALEKDALVLACGEPRRKVDGYHLTAPAGKIPLTPRMRTVCSAISRVAARPGFVPMGMSIGPFSLMTKLVTDPITPVFMAGSGVAAGDDPEVALVEQLLGLGERVIHDYLEAQIDAGARAIVVCEPAANLVYMSPKQLEETGYALFERYVMGPARRIKRLLDSRGVDLVFHDCGELTDGMIRRFATLDAAVLSFGSSRRLWEDARLVPKTTVLYGNLPSKKFFSRQLTAAEVRRLSDELVRNMAAAGHPFILGSECDVLSVPGSEREIMDKVDALMGCACGCPVPGSARSVPVCAQKS